MRLLLQYFEIDRTTDQTFQDNSQALVKYCVAATNETNESQCAVRCCQDSTYLMKNITGYIEF